MAFAIRRGPKVGGVPKEMAPTQVFTLYSQYVSIAGKCSALRRKLLISDHITYDIRSNNHQFSFPMLGCSQIYNLAIFNSQFQLPRRYLLVHCDGRQQ